MFNALRPRILAIKAQAQHWVGFRPVPLAVDVEASEQGLPSLEQRLDRIHEQAFAEAAGTGQEHVVVPVDQIPDERRLVDVVAVGFPQPREGLDTDGQALTSHCSSLS